MPQILHLEASPKGERSVSTAMARAFLEAYAQKHPDDELRTLNVWSDDLPRFGPVHANAKFAPIMGEERTPSQVKAWEEVTGTISEFDAADKIVVSCPMWNHGIPHALKNYIDLIVQPGLSFGFVPEKGGPAGLLRDRPTQLLLTRGSTPVDVPHDFQLPYLKHILHFIGIEDVRVLVAAATMKGPDEREAYREEQCALAAEAAGDF